MDPASVSALVATTTASISDVLVQSLPAILVVVAGLIGLTILMRFIRRNAR